MPHYHNLDDSTFKALIENDFAHIKRDTGGIIALVHSTHNDEPSNRQWHVRHGTGRSTILGDTEVAGFTLGVLTAIVAMKEMAEEPEVGDEVASEPRRLTIADDGTVLEIT